MLHKQSLKLLEARNDLLPTESPNYANQTSEEVAAQNSPYFRRAQLDFRGGAAAKAFCDSCGVYVATDRHHSG